MNKSVKLIILILLIILMGGILKYIVIDYNAEPIPPERKNTIPNSAIWYGGADGGVWISCKEYNSDENLFYCKIYNDNIGGLLYEGLFKYSGNDSISLEKIKDKIIGYDGVYIHLDITGDNGMNKKLIKKNDL